MAAVFAIVLGLIGKFGAVLQTIPRPVKGGVEMVLFGMIASVGVRIISESKLDLSSTRNLTIMGSTLCVGIGIGALGGVALHINEIGITVSGLFFATVIGVLLNQILPRDKKADETKASEKAQAKESTN